MNGKSAQSATLSHVLAPASSPAHPVSVAHYATQSWSSGGVILGVVILILLLLVFRALPGGPQLIGKSKSR